MGYIVAVVVPLGIALINRSGKSKEVAPDPTVMVPKNEYDALVIRIDTMDAQAHQLHLENENIRRGLNLELETMRQQRDDYFKRWAEEKDRKP